MHRLTIPALILTVGLFAATALATESKKSITETDLSPQKPKLETLLKPKTLAGMKNDHNTVVSAEWVGENGFAYVAGMQVNASSRFSRGIVTNYALYKQMSSAIKKFEYDAQKSEIEMLAEAVGFQMHSWIKVQEKHWDQVEYEVVRGNLAGFKITLWIWDQPGSKTILVMQGNHPALKTMLPSALALVAIPVSEGILGVASGNFRSYIESEYKKMRTGR